jgi:hypothetical protein
MLDASCARAGATLDARLRVMTMRAMPEERGAHIVSVLAEGIRREEERQVCGSD